MQERRLGNTFRQDFFEKNMNKDTLCTILKRLELWRYDDKKIRDALNSFSKSIASSSHPLVSDISMVTAFISGVCIETPWVKDDLEYFAFELHSMTTATGTFNGKEYNLKNLTDYLDFVFDRRQKVLRKVKGK